MIHRPLTALALTLALAVPAAAAPLSQQQSDDLASARELYRNHLTLPLTPADWEARYRVGPKDATFLGAYDRQVKAATAQAAKPDPRDPYFKRKGMWVRPYPSDATHFRVLEVFDRAQAVGVTEMYLETFYGGQVIYQRKAGQVFPTKYPGVDLAKAYAREARRRGIKLHAWIHTLKWGEAHAKAHPEYLVRDGWGKDATSTEGKYAFIVAPSVPAVREQLGTLIDEIASLGYYDGVYLDYIRNPIRLKGDDVDETPEPRNFWGYNPTTLTAFLAENPQWNTPEYREFLQTGHLMNEARRDDWLKVWKDWLAGELEELIAGLRARSKGKLQLGMAFFPNYYFHKWDNRAQESLRWMAHFDAVSPMCYSYFLDTFPDPFGHYNINRELTILHDGLKAYPKARRPQVIASLSEDAPGTPITARYHHRPFPTQIAYLKGRRLEGAFPDMTGVAYFSYGWMFPASDKARREEK